MPSWRAGGSWPLSLFCFCWFCWDPSLRPRAPDTCLDTGPGPVSRGTATCATSDPTSFCFSPMTRTWNWVNACPPPDLLCLFCASVYPAGFVFTSQEVANSLRAYPTVSTRESQPNAASWHQNNRPTQSHVLPLPTPPLLA